MEHSRANVVPACFMLAGVLLAPTAALLADWSPHEARYSVYRNGRLAGMAEVELQQRGEHWTITSRSRGTHGLARMIRARDLERVEGVMTKGRFVPKNFERETSVAGSRSGWSAIFDWPQDQVTVSSGRNQWQLPLSGEALDPLSLKVELKRRLRDGEDQWDFLLVDEDEIDQQKFRPLPEVMLETSLGCLAAIPVERVRRSGSKRYTRAWHVPELEFMIVRLEHGRVDGDHMEVRITELQLNQERFQPRPACGAQQIAAQVESE